LTRGGFKGSRLNISRRLFECLHDKERGRPIYEGGGKKKGRREVLRIDHLSHTPSRGWGGREGKKLIGDEKEE